MLTSRGRGVCAFERDGMGWRKNSLLAGALSIFLSFMLVVGLVPTLALAEIMSEGAERKQTVVTPKTEAGQNGAQQEREAIEGADSTSAGAAPAGASSIDATADGTQSKQDLASDGDGTQSDQNPVGGEDGATLTGTEEDSTQRDQDASEAKSGDDAPKAEDQQKEKPDSAQAQE